MDKLIKSIWTRLRIDRVTGFTFVQQAQGTLFVPIIIWLVVRYLTPDEQGFYYTFGGVLGLQTLLELGFTQCILQFSSHECADLAWNDQGWLEGNQHHVERLKSLARLTLKWYAVAALLLFLALEVAGKFIFAAKVAETVAWQLPWHLCCLAACVTLVAQPVWAILDGAHQREWAIKGRTALSIVRSAMICLGLLGGWKLGALAVGLGVQALAGLVVLFICWWKFLRQLYGGGPPSSRMSWREEILPFQWRIALSWTAGYVIFFSLNPIVFKLSGPVAAGRFGMTFNLFQTVAAFSGSWVSSNYPRFGHLAAKGEAEQLFSFWRGAAFRATIAAAVFSAMITLAVMALGYAGLPLAQRLLPPVAVALLGVSAVANTLIQALALYLRAHKREPFLSLSLGNAALILAVVPLATLRYGAPGAAAGFAICTVLTLPWALRIFATFRERLPLLDAKEACEPGLPV